MDIGNKPHVEVIRDGAFGETWLTLILTLMVNGIKFYEKNLMG